MEEIKVGEFVRTKKGDIYKFLKIDKNKRLLGEYFDDVIYVCNSSREINKEYRIKEYQISKHSFNIIDLIEEGDYVNGYKVLEIAPSIYEHSKRILIYRNEKESFERWIYIQEYDGKIHTQDDIESIVTKEQFKAMEYVIKEK